MRKLIVLVAFILCISVFTVPVTAQSYDTKPGYIGDNTIDTYDSSVDGWIGQYERLDAYSDGSDWTVDSIVSSTAEENLATVDASFSYTDTTPETTDRIVISTDDGGDLNSATVSDILVETESSIIDSVGDFSVNHISDTELEINFGSDYSLDGQIDVSITDAKTKNYLQMSTTNSTTIKNQILTTDQVDGSNLNLTSDGVYDIEPTDEDYKVVKIDVDTIDTKLYVNSVYNSGTIYNIPFTSSTEYTIESTGIHTLYVNNPASIQFDSENQTTINKIEIDQYEYPTELTIDTNTQWYDSTIPAIFDQTYLSVGNDSLDINNDSVYTSTKIKSPNDTVNIDTKLDTTGVNVDVLNESGDTIDSFNYTSQNQFTESVNTSSTNYVYVQISGDADVDSLHIYQPSTDSTDGSTDGTSTDGSTDDSTDSTDGSTDSGAGFFDTNTGLLLVLVLLISVFVAINQNNQNT